MQPNTVSRIDEENSEDLGATSKAESPLMHRSLKEGEMLKKSIG